MVERRPQPIFNAIHDTYDNVSMLRTTAERLAAIAKLGRGQQVLDIACGTGWATMAAAKAVGNTGKVTGIDIADKMLEVARQKAESAGLTNVEFHIADAEALGFDDASFDAVICASSIFFLKDILKALHEGRRVLKTGGTIAFSSFGASFLQPLTRLFVERLSKYDGQKPSGPNFTERTDKPEKCRELLKNTDFKKIEITTEQLGYYCQDATAYWKETTSAIIRLRIERLSPTELKRFKAEHLSEVESLRTDKGIWLDIPVHFSVAIKRS